MVQPPRCDVLPPRRCSEKGSREIGSRPTDCGIGQLSLTFALLRGGVGRSHHPSLSPPFLFVSCIFIYHPFLQLLSFYLSTPIILHSLFSLFLSFLSFFLSPLLPLAPTSFTFYRHSHPPSSSSSFFPSFLFFLPFFFRSRSLSISVSLFRSSDGNDILAMEEMG